MSTFHGLEMAKQALFAQQSALYTTGHNISNANTKGYTRQRVDFETTSAYSPAARNRPEIAGQLGTGVNSGSVQRIRNQFLDYQFRSENSKAGYWETKADALSRMETLMNEPSEQGLNKTMDQFWQSLQDLAANPESSGARSVVAQRGQAVADTFNYLSDSLSSMRADVSGRIDLTKNRANTILEKVNSINKQVKNIETNGQLANDLYDERDRLIDELSGIVKIDVGYTKSSDSAPDIADGLATIKLAGKNGETLDSTAVLVNGDLSKGELDFNKIDIDSAEDGYKEISSINVNGESYSPTQFTSEGSLTGLIESYGYSENGETAGTFPDMLNDLDTMASKFAKAFNDVHNDGADLKGEQGIPNFFKNASDQGAAANITVNENIMNEPDLIAASNGKGSGDGGNASDLADVFTDTDVGLGENTSVKSFYESIIGDMGVNAEKANTMVENTGILKSQVETQRESVSSVSLDEEMSNMIKFQQAYNAAARSMTTVDELLDRVINNMGLVGR
ncbi:flagellar hook-associated protein FlgK [Lentibacillus cibarius]|uniref:Flagellar hook-associated protein 1 n=1 Tax=Lentibacillus cibarius TaxID=2583219 RepID=A0A5S3QLJ8_9BACI|nr:flagellar hook-associated protein FlgK [Lentibacillus cibarius]TMN21356.1 flagellar hook-associated protein FlgK [Lentibacillus cibarius]